MFHQMFTNVRGEKGGFLTYLGGLRGLAIMMIVLFHLLPAYFSQGFLGVEIFLVISGYLLFKGWKEGEKFRFFKFAEKKIVRIVPMLCVLVLIVVPIFGVIATKSDSVRMLGSSAIASMLGISNFYYSKAYSDYFATGANLNPLLHTWYLSLTMQVYFIWAIGAVITGGWNKNVRVGIIIIVACASLVYDYLPEIQALICDLGVSVPVSQDASYYGTANRLWQVLAGGLFFLIPFKLGIRTADVLSSVSLVILLGVVYCNQEIGVYAPMLVVCCTVILLYSLPCSRVRRLIEHPSFLWLGKVSFSLYIIHFPIIVFYKQWERALPGIYASMIMLAIMFVLACLYWSLIERRKFRFYCVVILSCVAGTVALLGRYNERTCLAVLSPDAKFTYPAYETPLTSPHTSAMVGFDRQCILAQGGTYGILYDKDIEKPEPLIALGDPLRHPEFVVVGDSNAQHWFAGFNALSTKCAVSGIHLDSVVISFWDVFVYLDPGYCWNEEKAVSFLNWLKEQRDVHTVVISQIWSRLTKGFEKNWKKRPINASFYDSVYRLRKFCEEVKKVNKRVVLVMPSPRLFDFDKQLHGTGLEYLTWLNERDCLQNGELPHAFVMTEARYREFYSDVLELFELWEKEGFCDVLHIEKGIFRHGDFLGVRDGVLRVRDGTHITPPESIEILQEVAEDFVKIIDKGRRHNESSKLMQGKSQNQEKGKPGEA